MKIEKKSKLEAAGWKVGNAEDFLGLTDEEIAYIQLKLALSKNLRAQRKLKKLTQVQVAQMLKSNQARIARMEAGDPSVSVDQLIKSLLVLGTTKQELGEIISTAA